MKDIKNSATIPQSRLNQYIARNDNAAANQAEIEEQIEEDTVENEARKNTTRARSSVIRGNKDLKIVDNASASTQEVDEQVEESRIDKVSFEDGVSPATAEEYIQRGRGHG